MRLPFSYRSDLFAQVLFMSLASHGLLVATGFLRPSPIQFSVTQAPSSVDVFMIQEEFPAPAPEKIIAKELNATEPVKKVTAKEKRIEKTEWVNQPVQGTVSEVIPAADHNPAPPYPYVARLNGWEGVVHLKVQVEKDGRPSQVSVQQSSGHSVLDESAVQTIKRWRFRAARRGAVEISSWAIIPVKFSLIDN